MIHDLKRKNVFEVFGVPVLESKSSKFAIKY